MHSLKEQRVFDGLTGNHIFISTYCSSFQTGQKVLVPILYISSAILLMSSSVLILFLIGKVITSDFHLSSSDLSISLANIFLPK